MNKYNVKPIVDKMKNNKGKAQAELKAILDQQEKLRRAEQLRQQQAEELRRQTELLRLNRERESERLEEREERQRTVEENLEQQDVDEQQARQEIASKDLTALQNNTGASPAQIAAAGAVTVAVAQNLTSNPAAKNLYNQDPHKAETQSITTPPVGQDPAKTIAQDPHALADTKTNHPKLDGVKTYNIGAYVVNPETGKAAPDVLSNEARVEGAKSVGATSGQQTAHGIGDTKLESVAKSSMAPDFGIDFKKVDD